jgi:hypothetical protein
MIYTWWILIIGWHTVGDPYGVGTFKLVGMYQTPEECRAQGQVSTTGYSATWFCNHVELKSP